MAKKAKGFGQKREVPTREAKQLLLTFGERSQEQGQDSVKLERFVALKLDELDESLLESLPLAFNQLIKQCSPSKQRHIAGIANDLAVFLCKFPQGQRWLNLELNIVLYQLGLKVFRHDEFPEAWAMTQNNLANAYKLRPSRVTFDRIAQRISNPSELGKPTAFVLVSVLTCFVQAT